MPIMCSANSSALKPFVWRGQDIPVLTRVNARAKRLNMRVQQSPLALLVTHPPRVLTPQIQHFIEQHAPWVERQLVKHAVSKERPLEILGHPYTVKRTTEASHITNNVIYLRAAKDLIPLLRKESLRHLSPLVQQYAERLGEPFQHISIKDTKSRWGSCSVRKNISLSWRLILTPPDVMHYVVAHEVAHLRHMNHSAAFWSTLDTLVSHAQKSRKWLRQHGSRIMAFPHNFDLPLD